MQKSLLLAVLFPFILNAHPPVGIVADSKSNIYYSDLQQVWKIDRFGNKTIVVPHVHTHELAVDKLDRIFGQESIYSGEATNTYQHAVWMYDTKNNKRETIVPVTEGFYIHDYSFVRDDAGNMYWIKVGAKDTTLMKTTPSGKSTLLARGDFKRVQWMHFANDHLYYIQSGNIYSVDVEGVIKPFIHNLQGNLFGLWSDKDGNLYVANHTQRIIHKINKEGETQTFYKSPGDWAPTGGTFDHDGNLWVLETNTKHEIRAIKANTYKTKQVHQNSSGIPSYMYYWFAGALALSILLKSISRYKEQKT
ncbi:MAG TPA: hypothetical protein VM368_08210 [Flavisolibacter sp.]|nr:hypothetical protein [Flavisolibacter sp.]